MSGGVRIGGSGVDGGSVRGGDDCIAFENERRSSDCDVDGGSCCSRLSP